MQVGGLRSEVGGGQRSVQPGLRPPTSDVRPPTCLIANPAAGRGRGARLLPDVRALLAARGVHDVRVTRGRGDERRLARDAAAEGVDTIIALGGDGTWGNAARGILESGKDARLALLAAGTGNDLSYVLGLPESIDRLVSIGLGDRELRIDVGRVAGIHFLNVAGFGFETSVLEASASVPVLRGPLLYFATAVPKLFTFAAVGARVSVDGGAPDSARLLALIAANGSRFGGGFRVAPGASLTDGLLDIVSVRDGNALRRAVLFGRVRLGTHLGMPEVKLRRARAARVEFERPPLIDVDGELVQSPTAQVEIRCIPHALRVAVL